VIGELKYTPSSDPVVQQSFVKAQINNALTSVEKFQDTIEYFGTESDIEAVTPDAGSKAIASDTLAFGVYDGTAWVWDAEYVPKNGFFYTVLNLLDYSPARSGSIVYSEQSGAFGVTPDKLLMPDEVTLEITENGTLGLKDGAVTIEKLAGELAAKMAKIDFIGSQAVTSLTSLAVTKQIVNISTSGNQVLSIASVSVSDAAFAIVVKAAANITVTLPATGDYVSMYGDLLSVDSGKVAIIHVFYNTVDLKYYINVEEEV
jgi:hypothetical protein